MDIRAALAYYLETQSIGYYELGELLFCIMITYVIINYLCAHNSVLIKKYACIGLLYSVALVNDMSIITTIIAYVLPYLIFLEFLYHQKSIQHYMWSRSVAYTEKPHSLDVIERILYMSIKAFNKQRNIAFIIERQTPLFQQYIAQSTLLEIPLSNATIDMCIESTLIDYDKLLLVKEGGILHASNGLWSKKDQTTHFSQELFDDTVLYLSQTDGIGIFGNHSTRTYHIIAHDTVIKNINSSEFFSLLSALFQRTSVHKPCLPFKDSNDHKAFFEKNR